MILNDGLETFIKEYVASTVKRAISESEKYFIEFVKEHRTEIFSELVKSGKYVIKSPWGLTATITVKEKSADEKQS